MAQGGRFCGRTLSRCVGAKYGTRFPMVNAMHGGRVICDHPDRFCGLSEGRVRRMPSGGTPLPNEGRISERISGDDTRTTGHAAGSHASVLETEEPAFFVRPLRQTPHILPR